MLLGEKDLKIPNLSKSEVELLTIEVIESDINTDDINTKKKNGCVNSVGIVISNASAKWTDIQTCNTLENINLNIIPGQLVAIIGPVGAGKVHKNYKNNYIHRSTRMRLIINSRRRYLMFRQRQWPAAVVCRRSYLLLDACAGDSSVAGDESSRYRYRVH